MDINSGEIALHAPIEMAARTSNHLRSNSTTSRFYEAEIEDAKVRNFIEETSIHVKHGNPDLKLRQSRHLPLWAWYIIASCNGIPLRPGAKPILGTILHALSFGSALSYALSYTWYVTYDTASPKTPRDIPGAVVSILLVMIWCGFGFYCKDLSSRLFLHPRFLKDIRMHTRTVFKVNGALLVFLVGLLFTMANIFESLHIFTDNSCTIVDLEEVVCTVMGASSILFCIFTLIWHSLVSFIFMSVCRTHTIGLRRFIKEVEYDASLMERHLSFTHKIPLNQDDIWQESMWIAEDENDADYVDYQPQSRHTMSILKKDINPPNDGQQNRSGEISVLFSPIVENIEPRDDRSDFEWNYDREDKDFIPVQRVLESSKGVPIDSATTPHTMSNAELMHHFWKLNCRLRFSSCAMQRWYASFVSLVLVRCSTYLVRWLSHPATSTDILQFVLPLFLLVVLSTALAEVNFEGQRVMRCIYPTEQRIKPLQYMALNALQMSIYGFGLTHGTIVTVVFAIMAAFVSKIVITEMTKAPA